MINDGYAVAGGRPTPKQLKIDPTPNPAHRCSNVPQAMEFACYCDLERHAPSRDGVPECDVPPRVDRFFAVRSNGRDTARAPVLEAHHRWRLLRPLTPRRSWLRGLDLQNATRSLICSGLTLFRSHLGLSGFAGSVLVRALLPVDRRRSRSHRGGSLGPCWSSANSHRASAHARWRTRASSR
jgi:hypothetical protein